MMPSLVHLPVKSHGGFFMAESIPNSPRRDSRSFRQIVDAFLGGEGLPFAEVLSSDRIELSF